MRLSRTLTGFKRRSFGMLKTGFMSEIQHQKILLMVPKLCVPKLICFYVSDELVHEKEKFKAISDELDQTFAEMSGY